MAKASFAKLGLKVNSEIKSIIVADQEIEIKQFFRYYKISYHQH